MGISKAAGPALAAALFASAAVQAQTPNAKLSGNGILARAATASGLRSYSVPVHFDVRMHKPMGVKVGVDGTAYFKAPAQSALVITKAPPLIGGFFKGSYNIDMLPQAWPAKYSVTSVSTAQLNGVAAYVLRATPKIDNGVDHVLFNVEQAGYAPISAQWFYRDQSTIGLAISSERVANFTLPQSESVQVAMPKYSLDATSSFGQYALNVPVPDQVFASK